MLKNEIIEKLRELEGYAGDYEVEFKEYNDGYISDIIAEIADNQVSIYYDGLCNWLQESNNSFDYCNRAIYELGANDIESILRGGQYLQAYDELYEYLVQQLINWSIDYVENSTSDDLKLTDEQVDELYEFIENIDANKYDRLDDIADEINEILNANDDE